MKWKSNLEDMPSLMPHDTTHTHTHMQVTTVEGVFCLYPILASSSPRDSQEQWAASDAAPQRCGARGPSPSARSWLGQGQDRRASALFACFYCWGSTGGTRVTRGEHAKTPHRKAREQAPTYCTMRDLNPQPSCCEAAVLRTVPPCPSMNFSCKDNGNNIS